MEPTKSGSLTTLPSEQRETLLRSVLERVIQGERTADIASAIGTTRGALTQALLKHAEEDWRDAQAVRALGRLDDAEDQLDKAENSFEVAKATARIKAAQWNLERLLSKLYGDHMPASMQAIQINIGINRPQQGSPND